MPTYEYKCEACGHDFEQFQSITADPIRKCPACGKNKVKRLIGMGAGLIFKGSGFYQTDYRSEGYHKAANADKSSASSSSAKSTDSGSSKNSDSSSSGSSSSSGGSGGSGSAGQSKSDS
ncbi:MAG: zinc ribbon domain-containing protein [Sedimentisphaerales bacterium]|nr:zinc ribbon domain-containing protein [Sedimentisphaerales bacterium]